MLLEAGQADAALIGGSGDWWRYLTEAMPAIRRSTGVGRLYALSALVIGSGTRFICDTHMNLDPTAEEIAEMVPMAAEVVRRFGLPPKVALLSHSSFGSSSSPGAQKMRDAMVLIRSVAPELEVDGEMQADVALSEALRQRMVRDSPLEGSANLLVMPTLDAANIALSLLAAASEGLVVGPILLGPAQPLHIL